MESIVHNHIKSDSICDSASRLLKLDLMITFNLMVWLGFMTSRFDRYSIKIIWWNEINDLVTKIKMHIFKVKLPFYPPCEVKCGLQNGVSTAWDHRIKQKDTSRNHGPQSQNRMQFGRLKWNGLLSNRHCFAMRYS